MPANPHGQQARLVTGFKALDLQMMFGMPKAGVADLVRKLGILRHFAEHALVEFGPLARHAGFEFVTTA